MYRTTAFGLFFLIFENVIENDGESCLELVKVIEVVSRVIINECRDVIKA